MKPTVAEIDLSAIEDNIKQIQTRVSPAEVMAVVKANAYGHGAVEVSRLAIQTGVEQLGVAKIEEALHLRKAGIRAPILVFGGVLPGEEEYYAANDLEATLSHPIHLDLLGAAKKPTSVHIKIDTGMGRLGLPWQRSIPFIQKCAGQKKINIKGLYTHFATSDEADKSYSCLQLKRFHKVLDQCRQLDIDMPRIHCANSGAILDMPETYFNMVRPGISIYGYYPSAETSESLALRPAMTFICRVLHIKEVEKGTSISYGRKFITAQKTQIATLSVGYADGYNRLLTNIGTVLIHDQVFPVVGRVCMDFIMVDVGTASNIKVGDQAILFGRHETVNVQTICRQLNTIPYEVTCWVSSRVPRIYKKRGNLS